MRFLVFTTGTTGRKWCNFDRKWCNSCRHLEGCILASNHRGEFLRTLNQLPIHSIDLSSSCLKPPKVAHFRCIQFLVYFIYLCSFCCVLYIIFCIFILHRSRLAGIYPLGAFRQEENQLFLREINTLYCGHIHRLYIDIVVFMLSLRDEIMYIYTFRRG